MPDILLSQIALPFTEPAEEAVALAGRKLKAAGIPASSLAVYRRSIDCRRREVRFVYAVRAAVPSLPDDDTLKALGASAAAEAYRPCPGLRAPDNAPRPVVVGFGPCGMAAALLLAERGYRPIVLERGGDVESRAAAVDAFSAGGALDPDTNVQFGAGGAGTFSDGKLTTRIHDPACRLILETFARFGAGDSILTDGKPHIGTDVLRKVVGAISDAVVRLGGEVRYRARMDGLTVRGGRVTAVRVAAPGGGYTLECPALFLAAGHSARDTFVMLREAGLTVLPKAFSVGVRIEQSQRDIDRAVYGKAAGHPLLPAADYQFSHREPDGSAVYTFCMCPGGKVIAAASEAGGVVTNGMSDRARDGKNANAALVVSAAPAEPMEFQRMLERRAFETGGGGYGAPVQTVGDFLDGTLALPPKRILPTYTRGVTVNARLDALFPEEITRMLRLGLTRFGAVMPAFAPRDAVLTGAETRTSSPYRVLREDGTFTAPGAENLYPCGEGAGYAGGIMSATADGLRCAERYILRTAVRS